MGISKRLLEQVPYIDPNSQKKRFSIADNKRIAESSSDHWSASGTKRRYIVTKICLDFISKGSFNNYVDKKGRGST